MEERFKKLYEEVRFILKDQEDLQDGISEKCAHEIFYAILSSELYRTEGEEGITLFVKNVLKMASEGHEATVNVGVASVVGFLLEDIREMHRNGAGALKSVNDSEKIKK